MSISSKYSNKVQECAIIIQEARTQVKACYNAYGSVKRYLDEIDHETFILARELLGELENVNKKYVDETIFVNIG